LAKQIFRKVALDRLSSPEQLDQLMQVTTSKGWVAMLAIILLLSCAMFWGIFGSIPSKVAGQGILVKSGGVFDVVSPSAGVIKGIYFGPGDIVKKGQVAARLEQRELLNQLEDTRKVLHEQEIEYERVSKHGTKEMQMEHASIDQQQANINHVIAALKTQVIWHKENVRNQEELLKEGLITRQQLLRTKSELDKTIQEQERLNNELKQLKIRILQIEENKTQKSLSIKQQINSTKRTLALLNDNLRESSKVVSPYTGKVLEVAVEEGMIINRGTPILLIELIGSQIKNLEAVLYFPAREGKKIRQGMKVQIAPSTVKQEEHGFILGIVTSTADYPSTAQAMMKILKNENLVRSLSMGGAPISINADLIPAPYTPSGYKWSSSKGPSISIDTGTICFATVTVSEQKPISLVIPLFKKYILGTGIGKNRL